MIEGSEKVEIAGAEYWLAPLNFAAVRKYGKFMAEMNTGSFDMGRDLPTIAEILLSSLRRNHPDISQDWFDENVDTRNMQLMFMAVNKASIPPPINPVGELQPAAEENGRTPTGKDSTST